MFVVIWPLQYVEGFDFGFGFMVQGSGREDSVRKAFGV